MTQANPDQLLLDLCERAAVLEAAVLAEYAAYQRDENQDHEEIIDALEETLDPLHDQILAIRPTTLAGLIAKAKRASYCRLDHDPNVREMDDCTEVFDTAIIRDILAMEGCDNG